MWWTWGWDEVVVRWERGGHSGQAAVGHVGGWGQRGAGLLAGGRQAANSEQTEQAPGPPPRPHLFCATMTTPCRTAHHKKVCTERATEGESTGRLSMSMEVPMDQ